jgi:hypothetical protein
VGPVSRQSSSSCLAEGAETQLLGCVGAGVPGKVQCRSHASLVDLISFFYPIVETSEQ